MRVPTVEPRRRSRFRFRGWIIGVVVVLIVLLFSLRGLAGFYTDYLWFDSIGQGGTWSADGLEISSTSAESRTFVTATAWGRSPRGRMGEHQLA